MALKKFVLGCGLALCMGVSLGILTNCVGYVQSSRAGYYEDDDYVYYPDYEVYYSQRHHDYVYLEGNSWVRSRSPSNVSVDILYSSPSVGVSFHDAPEHHHSDMRHQYPKHWRNHDNGKDHDDDHGRDKHKDKD